MALGLFMTPEAVQISAECFGKKGANRLKGMAGTTGLEPATSDVTGRRSNQLNYVPACHRAATTE